MTNAIIISILVSTNATFHWERSPDVTVTGYVMYASADSRFIKERWPVQFTVPTLPGQPPLVSVLMRNTTVGTNADWKLTATNWVLGNVTNWTVTQDTLRRYYAVAARDNTGAESDLSNEVLFDPQWCYVNLCIEGSVDMKNWDVMGTTNVLRFWRGVNRTGSTPGFFRGRLVITNENR